MNSMVLVDGSRTGEDTTHRLGRLRNLPPFNVTAVKLLSLPSDEDCSPCDLEALFRSDPALAGELLVAANSAMFGLQGQISTLRHAIAVLGLERIRMLAMTIATGAHFRSGFTHDLVRPIWSHAVATAVIAEHLSKYSEGLQGSFMYVAGLTHDLGRLGLMSRATELYRSVLTMDFCDIDESIEFERQSLGMTHMDAGAFFAQAWGFPKSFCDVSLNHHSPCGADSEGGRVIQTACALAEKMGYPEVRLRENRGGPPLDEWQDERLEGTFRQTVESRIREFDR